MNFSPWLWNPSQLYEHICFLWYFHINVNVKVDCLWVMLFSMCYVVFYVLCCFLCVMLFSMCYVVFYVLCCFLSVMLFSMCYVVFYVLCCFLWVMLFSMCYVVFYVLCCFLCVMLFSMCYVVFYELCCFLCVSGGMYAKIQIPGRPYQTEESSTVMMSYICTEILSSLS